MTTISDIRSILNVDVDTLPDAAITIAISRSDGYISTLGNRSGASAEDITRAKLNYAAFLAYQTYADRIVEQVPGSFDQQGMLQPISNPIARQVGEKLRSLKDTADESVDLIRNTPIFCSIDETPGPVEAAEDYPVGLKLSNLNTFW